jgi:hypothetical protein
VFRTADQGATGSSGFHSGWFLETACNEPAALYLYLWKKEKPGAVDILSGNISQGSSFDSVNTVLEWKTMMIYPPVSLTLHFTIRQSPHSNNLEAIGIRMEAVNLQH